MKKLLKYILTNLVDHPDGVSVSVDETDRDINVTANVNPEDMGRVIGKHGRTVNALRTLAKVLAIKSKKRLTLQLGE